ncbi:Cupin domain protein [Pedobacter westerhofensis]|uniref:Cupin domain protein n=1 Tax=Pedobacter westerhofensis TaxID=425512 RepID=A0A521C426_9SPHI|nr:cupin domain-containing protein [Pedobacter westerhofensis]SMO54154.1 Cupin domain protein [Pedobacter westerhofensis]
MKKNLQEFIASGILELYVLGDTSDEEDAEVLIMSSKFPAEIAHEIMEISMALEYFSLENAVEPSARLRENLFSKFFHQGNAADKSAPQSRKYPRPASEIPRLTHFSKIEDYTDWFDPEDLITPADFKGARIKLLGQTAEMTTMLICATAIEGEVHHEHYERLLVIEGSCDVIVENKVFSFHKGDFIDIPLHKWHDVVITSAMPCKAILQRIPV